MTKEEIIAMFPVTVEIPEQRIKLADPWIITECVGALSLKMLFPGHKCTWGAYEGTIYLEDNYVFVQSFNGNNEPLNCIEINKPIQVTFKLRENEPIIEQEAKMDNPPSSPTLFDLFGPDNRVIS